VPGRREAQHLKFGLGGEKRARTEIQAVLAGEARQTIHLPLDDADAFQGNWGHNGWGCGSRPDRDREDVVESRKERREAAMGTVNQDKLPSADFYQRPKRDVDRCAFDVPDRLEWDKILNLILRHNRRGPV